MNKKLENNIDSRATVYQELCNSYRAIDDFRAKLLGFLPLASGTGIFLLIRPVDGNETKMLLWAAGAFGFFITLGLFFYELYGVKKCHALINAGKELEEDLGIDAQRGQFMARPRDVAGLINEPIAAGVIYPAVLAAWTFLALVFTSQDARLWAIIISITVFVVGFAVVLAFNFKLGKEEDIRKTLNNAGVKLREDKEVTMVHVLEYLWIKARPEKSRNDPVVSRDPDVMHGELIFTGTRVPAKTLVDYIRAGRTLDDFLAGFPSVRREKAEAYLELTLKTADLARSAR